MTIKELREARGWTQLDLAVRSGVSIRTITAWETGRRNPSQIYISAVARAFGVAASEIAA